MKQNPHIKAILEGKASVVLVTENGEAFSALGRGIAPLAEFFRKRETGEIPQVTAAYDKIVGRAAAALLVGIGVRKVYALVMSAGAKEFLAAHGIECGCGCGVDVIVNRGGDGMCPLESRVAGITGVQEIIAETLIFYAEMSRMHGHAHESGA